MNVMPSSSKTNIKTPQMKPAAFSSQSTDNENVVHRNCVYLTENTCKNASSIRCNCKLHCIFLAADVPSKSMCGTVPPLPYISKGGDEV
jgi:hypothetical protein